MQVDPTARTLAIQQLQRYVAYLMAPDADPTALGAASLPELVLTLLANSGRLQDSASHLQLLLHFGSALLQAGYLHDVAYHLRWALEHSEIKSSHERGKLSELLVALLVQQHHAAAAEVILDPATPPPTSAVAWDLLSASVPSSGHPVGETPSLRALHALQQGDEALAHQRLGEALAAYDQAVTLSSQLLLPTLAARAEVGIARSLQALGEGRKALAHYRLALSHQEALNDQSALLRTELHLSALALQLQDYPQAHEWASQALLRARQLGALPEEALSLQLLGESHLAEGEWLSAGLFLEQALTKGRWLSQRPFLQRVFTALRRLNQALEQRREPEEQQRLWLQELCRQALSGQESDPSANRVADAEP